jgi:hypothetical protein
VPVLPVSARFALWFSAWVDGGASLDDVRDAIVGEDAAHDVTGLPGSPESRPLIVALGLLRGHGASGAGVALPVPGDLLGLAGPPGFNVEALEAGEAVVLEDVDLGLVPHREGAGVQWVCHRAASHRQVPAPPEAESVLRHRLLRAAEALAELDVARWRPELADELMAVRAPMDLPVPAVMAPGAVRLASLAARCRRVVALALVDEGASVTAAEADARRAALLPLEQASRRALVTASSPRVWPPP